MITPRQTSPKTMISTPPIRCSQTWWYLSERPRAVADAPSSKEDQGEAEDEEQGVGQREPPAGAHLVEVTAR